MVVGTSFDNCLENLGRFQKDGTGGGVRWVRFKAIASSHISTI